MSCSTTFVKTLMLDYERMARGADFDREWFKDRIDHAAQYGYSKPQVVQFKRVLRQLELDYEEWSAEAQRLGELIDQSLASNA